MGVTIGAHDYLRKMEGEMDYNMGDFIKTTLKNHRNKQYTREQFVKDYIYIANQLNILVDRRLYGKSLILSLISIKLDHGEPAFKLELARIKRRI